MLFAHFLKQLVLPAPYLFSKTSRYYNYSPKHHHQVFSV